jgi:hypothetical protein
MIIFTLLAPRFLPFPAEHEIMISIIIKIYGAAYESRRREAKV